MPRLSLYHFTECPYCAKVYAFLKTHGVTIPMKNIRENPKFREELISIGGKGQVPCLVIDGKAMYESEDIVQWMEKNLIKR